MSLFIGTLRVLGMAFAAILFLTRGLWASPSLCLAAHPAGGRLASYDLPPGDGFDLTFIHSVSRTPVRDSYVLRDGAILQTAEIFEAHGAGLPSLSNEVGATGWRHENGHFILEMERPIGTMIVRVQPAYDNALRIGDRTIPLASLGQKALRISACEEQDNE